MNIKYAIKATFAVFERQLLIMWRKRIYFILSLLMPAFIIFGIGPAAEFLTGGSVSTEYMITGIICFSIIFGSMQGPLSLLQDKEQGYLKVELVSPIPRFSIILGQSLSGGFRAILQSTLIYSIALISGQAASFSINPLNIMGFLLMGVIISIFVEGFFSGLLALTKNVESFSLASQLIGMPLILLSNVFIPTNSYQGLLSFIRYFGYFNPVNHALNGIRYFLLGYCPGFEPWEPWIGPVSILLVSAYAAICTISGTYLFLRSVKK
ncbi:MAG: ABC transporter permease subunit [Candidatus Lokiarchaeota archaeon]|nr:ABC transporter permease subunit [Candidatus Lokiarchaeota archaeon]